MDKNNRIAPLLFALLIMFAALAFSFQSKPGGAEPWSEKQLMPPSELAEIINNEKLKPPHIISVSPEGMYGLAPGKGIRGAVEYGPADEPQNLDKLKSDLESLPRDAPIVLYCGCCPFKDCPNIRPAFALLNDMNFTQHKLLNLEKNIRINWINKGYPMGE